ncbi:MAG: ABC transporter C-terminal domain-containing protein [Bacteroidota bacterium]
MKKTLYRGTACLYLALYLVSTPAFAQWDSDGSQIWANTKEAKVGIGTNEPGAQLHIVGSLELPAILLDSEMDFAATRNQALQFGQWDGSFLEYMRITRLGRLGINTTSPSGRVEISHNSTGASPHLVLHETHSDYARLSFMEDGTTAWHIAGKNTQLNFWNGSTNRMTILDGGNVGIGTSSPAALLHLNASSPRLRLESNASSILGSAELEFISAGTSSDNPNGMPGEWTIKMYSNSYAHDFAQNELSLQFTPINSGNPTRAMHFEQNGSVGIGSEMDLRGELDINAENRSIHFHVKDFNTEAPLVDLFRTSWIEFRHEGNTRSMIQSFEDDGSLRFWTGGSPGSPIPTLTMSGSNVGIGMTNPGETLDVAGNIRSFGGDVITAVGSFIAGSRELRVPDYVFSESYQLESIEAHAAFMWSEGHLPAVTSEKALKENDLYDMAERREQILEELEKAHIYIEQLNNRIKTLEKRLADAGL